MKSNERKDLAGKRIVAARTDCCYPSEKGTVDNE